MRCINCGIDIPGSGVAVCSAGCHERVLVTFVIRSAAVQAGILEQHEVFDIPGEFRGRIYVGPRRPLFTEE